MRTEILAAAFFVDSAETGVVTLLLSGTNIGAGLSTQLFKREPGLRSESRWL